MGGEFERRGSQGDAGVVGGWEQPENVARSVKEAREEAHEARARYGSQGGSR